MFSTEELIIIANDVECYKRDVIIPDCDRKTRNNIVKKITLHIKQSESLLCPDPSCGSKSLWNWVGTNTYRCNNCGYEWKQ